MAAGDAIVVSGLTKRYDGVVALDGIDLSIPRATVTGVIGANGSGKSTLIRILSGDVRVDSGIVRVLDHDPANKPAVLRRRTSYVAQAVELDPEMTGNETLRLFATLQGV